MIPKSKRKEDEDLLELVRSQRCVECARTGPDPCHVKSRGAGGPDESWNVLPLCRVHHTEQHKIGWVTFAERHPRVLLWLEANGWKIIGRKLLRE